MYSNKENVNILTSLLVAHGVSRAVVCPGSRNAPIVHNLNACPDMECYSVTDERSAGFVALGMAQASDMPVVVCVTSGSALLNLAPAVAEAYHQHLPLIVISADRPASWINQQDGQTIVQSGALDGIVAKSVNLPEPHTDEERWHCNRLVNEAVNESRCRGLCPVHINVPISEPLFEFTLKKLPYERMFNVLTSASTEKSMTDLIINSLHSAEKPMIVIGQMNVLDAVNIRNAVMRIEKQCVVFYECLGVECENHKYPLFDSVVDKIKDSEEYKPDTILYIGGTLISKRMRNFLRSAKKAQTIVVNTEARIYDTFMNLHYLVQGNPVDVLENIADNLSHEEQNRSATLFYKRWVSLFNSQLCAYGNFVPRYSQMCAVSMFYDNVITSGMKYFVHAANSMAVRLANIYAENYVFCDRGVNGIEGCLSTAAGFFIENRRRTYCIIGDLSFFYDGNALWNKYLDCDFRILLLNNGGGGIFNSLPGLSASPAKKKYVSACHDTDAAGLCASYHVNYVSAKDISQLETGMYDFINNDYDRPVLFEVFTHQDEDNKVYDEFINMK